LRSGDAAGNAEQGIPDGLLPPQRGNRINAGGSPRRKVACGHRNDGQGQSQYSEGYRIGGCHAVEQVRHEAGESERTGNADGDAQKRQTVPCHKIRPSTSLRCAPRAMRIPISCVRCPTTYAITP
jgi:hypothetical protein